MTIIYAKDLQPGDRALLDPLRGLETVRQIETLTDLRTVDARSIFVGDGAQTRWLARGDFEEIVVVRPDQEN